MRYEFGGHPEKPAGREAAPGAARPGMRSSISAHPLRQDDHYPDFVVPPARAAAAALIDRCVAIRGSGVGVSICANKILGLRAAPILDRFSVR